MTVFLVLSPQVLALRQTHMAVTLTTNTSLGWVCVMLSAVSVFYSFSLSTLLLNLLLFLVRHVRSPELLPSQHGRICKSILLLFFFFLAHFY